MNKILRNKLVGRGPEKVIALHNWMGTLRSYLLAGGDFAVSSVLIASRSEWVAGYQCPRIFRLYPPPTMVLACKDSPDSLKGRDAVPANA